MPRRRRPVRLAPVPGQRVFFQLGTTLLVIGTLYWAKAILIPIALALLLAFALSPIVTWLERRGLGRIPSSLLVTVAALGVLTGIGWFAGAQVRNLSQDLPRYSENIKHKFQPVLHLIEGVERLERFGAPDPVEHPAGQPPAPENPLPGQPADGSKGPIPVTIVRPKGSEALAWLPTVLQPVGEGLATALLVTVLVVFMLVQRESVRDRFLALAGRRQLTATTRAMEDASRRVSRFLLLQACTNAAMGVIVTTGMLLIGVPYAPLWGLLTAALRFVPYVGIWLSSLFPIALAVAVFTGWLPALLVLAVYAGSDLVMTNAVEPLLFGHGTGVSALSLLVAAAFWAFLWGPIGLLLAVPLTVCLVVLGEYVPSLRFLRTLLGEQPEVDPAARFFHRVLSGQHDEATLLIREEALTHPLLDVYDGVLLSAIGQAKQEREGGSLSPEEEREFYRVTRGVMGGVMGGVRAETAEEKPDVHPVRVVSCSARGEADRLALLMLRDVARTVGCEVSIVAASRLAAEVQTRTARGETVAACIGAVSPGGLAQAAELTKLVRARCPGVKVVVGRWGVSEDKEGTAKFLTEAGVASVTWTLRETLAAVAPLPPPTGGKPENPA